MHTSSISWINPRRVALVVALAAIFFVTSASADWDFDFEGCDVSEEVYRLDWYGASDAIPNPAEFYTDPHCYDSSTSWLDRGNHLDFIPAAENQGGCGACFIASSVQALQINYMRHLWHNENVYPGDLFFRDPNAVGDYRVHGRFSLGYPMDKHARDIDRDSGICMMGSDVIVDHLLIQLDTIPISPLQKLAWKWFLEKLGGYTPAYFVEELIQFLFCSAPDIDDMCDGGFLEIITLGSSWGFTGFKYLERTGTVRSQDYPYSYRMDGDWSNNGSFLDYELPDNYAVYYPDASAWILERDGFWDVSGPEELLSRISDWIDSASGKPFLNDFVDFLDRFSVNPWEAAEIVGDDLLFCNCDDITAVWSEFKDSPLPPSVVVLMSKVPGLGLDCAAEILALGGATVGLKAGACGFLEIKDMLIHKMMFAVTSALFEMLTAGDIEVEYLDLDEDAIACLIKRYGAVKLEIYWDNDYEEWKLLDVYRKPFSTIAEEDVIRRVESVTSHAVLATGWITAEYEGEERKLFVVHNSHGEGDGQYYLLPYMPGIDSSAWSSLSIMNGLSVEIEGSDDPDGDDISTAYDLCREKAYYFTSDIIDDINAHAPAGVVYDLGSSADSFNRDDPVVNDDGKRLLTDYDCDGRSVACDNCPFVYNAKQEDSDHDGVGDACDTCPGTWNPPAADLDGDGVLDQFDLDGDGALNACPDDEPDCGDDHDGNPYTGGDVCDTDLDGDNASLQYAPPEIYIYEPKVEPPDEAPPADPTGECASFLWSLSEDRDEDSLCDTYNFTPERATWYPSAESGDVYPGAGFLKPWNVDTYTDYMNHHYTSDKYVLYYNNAALVDISNGVDGLSNFQRPGEAGYSWLMDYGAEGGEIYFGYETCIQNLVDVWRYYGGEASFQKLGDKVVAAFDEFPPTPLEFDDTLEKTFEESLDPDICRVDNCIRFARLQETESWTQLDPLSRFILSKDDQESELGTLASKYCWTPNLHFEAGDTGTDVKTTTILCTMPDGTEPDEAIDAEGYATWYINPDQQDSNDDGVGDQCSLWVDIDNLIQEHDGTSFKSSIWKSKTSWEDFAYQPESPWITEIYIDEVDGEEKERAREAGTGYAVKLHSMSGEFATVLDVKHLCNGCNKKCSVLRTVVPAKQRLSFDVTGFSSEPVRTTLGACSCAHLGESMCWGGFDSQCAHPPERGWDTPIETELKAYEHLTRIMEYVEPSYRPRYAGFRFWGNRTHNVDDKYAPDQESYWHNRILAPACQNENYILPLGGGWWFILPMFASWDEEPDTHSRDGWERVGCQEISMTYNPGDHRSMTWRHLGQQEPDPFDGTIPPDAGAPEQFWHKGHTTKMRLGVKPYDRLPHSPTIPCIYDGDCPKGSLCDANMCWHDKENWDYTGRDGWLRQWHSTVPTLFTLIGSEFEDHDRPYTEYQIGGKDAVVVMERQCEQWIWEPELPPVQEIFEVDIWWGVGGNIDWGGAVDPDPWFMGVVQQRSADVVSSTRVDISLSSGKLETKNWSAGVIGGAENFPAAQFGYASLSPTAEQAAKFFGYMPGDGLANNSLTDGRDRNPNDEKKALQAEIVIGGLLADGRPSPTAWIRRSWTKHQSFERIPLRMERANAEPRTLVDPELFFDPISGRLYVLGGGDQNSGKSEVRAINFAKKIWETRWDSAPNGLFLQAGAEIAVDRTKHQAYIVGSTAEGRTTEVMKLVVTDRGPALQPLRANGARPEARNHAAVVYQPDLGSILMFGGENLRDGGLREDLWRFDLRKGAWSKVSSAGRQPSARKGAHLIAGTRGQVFLLGGENALGKVHGITSWTLAAGNTRAAWSVQATDPQLRLDADMGSVSGVYNPDNPLVYELGAPQHAGRFGEIVQVTLVSPGRNLRIEAVPLRSSARVKKSNAKGRLSLRLQSGEEWKLAVFPINEIVKPGENLSYTIRMERADWSNRIGGKRLFPFARFDVSSDSIFVANWRTFEVYQRGKEGVSRVARLKMKGAIDVIVDGNYAYVADFFRGLQIFDVSDPSKPRLISKEWVLGRPDSIAKIGDRIYMGAGIFGVQIIDVSDPKRPQWVDSIRIRKPVLDVTAAGNLLSISAIGRGVELYSVGADYKASHLASYRTKHLVMDSSFHGNRLYLKYINGKVEIVDIRSFSNMYRVERLKDAEGQFSLRLDGDLAVKSTAMGVMDIYEVSPIAKQ